jgi:hypothetical protein
MTRLRLCAALACLFALTLALAAPSGATAGSQPRVVSLLPLPAELVPAYERADANGQPQAPDKVRCERGSRSMKDRPDVRGGRLVHVVYILATDAQDERLDTNGTIECSMRAQQQWLKEQAKLHWRLDTYKKKVRRNGRIKKIEMVDVTFIRSGKNVDELNNGNTVSQELQVAGLDKTDKRYLSYVEGGGAVAPCGDAFWPFDSQDPNSDGKYSQIYLLSVEGCHARDFGVPGNPSWVEMIAQQEIMHNDGMVPLGAPHGCGPLGLPAHVCTQGLVFAGEVDPESTDILFPYVVYPLKDKVMDIDNNDYFRHPFPYRDLDQSPYLEKA